MAINDHRRHGNIHRAVSTGKSTNDERGRCIAARIGVGTKVGLIALRKQKGENYVSMSSGYHKVNVRQPKELPRDQLQHCRARDESTRLVKHLHKTGAVAKPCIAEPEQMGRKDLVRIGRIHGITTGSANVKKIAIRETEVVGAEACETVQEI